MRIGAFELDLLFQQTFTLAEVVNGQARVLRFLRIRNVRGTASSYMQLRMELDGKSLRHKSVRGLPVGDDERALSLEAGIVKDLVLPLNLVPGIHMVRIAVSCGKTEQEFISSIEVLSAQYIPTDFARADFLASYVQTNDQLRNYAACAIERQVGADTDTLMQLMYDALQQKQLTYQPVSGMKHPDCQEIAMFSNTLNHGGSCADLSLLFASLMWNIGKPPAILLFDRHMAAGCYLTDDPPYDSLDSCREIMALVDGGLLSLVEITSVCWQKNQPYHIAQAEIKHLLQQNVPCMLINVQKLLRGNLITVPDAPQLQIGCPHCGYPSVPLNAAECPACRHALPAAQADVPPAEDEPVVYSTAIQYGPHQSGASVIRLQSAPEDILYIQDTWQGRGVMSIREQAFANSSVQTVILPYSIKQIGDYAFRGCSGLTSLKLPANLEELGTGAFSCSGLTDIHIPGHVRRIPRLAFAGCANLTSITLEEGLQWIDEKSFEECSSLRNVTIPTTAKQIARNAFPPHCQLILLSHQTRIL